MSTELSEYRKMVEEGLTQRLARCKGTIPEHLLTVLRGYLGGGGKRLRPTFVMLCCEGFGGRAADVVAAACAVEMYHNWTLIHDDVIDHDRVRRGKPAGHVLGASEGEESFGLRGEQAADYGTSVAILSGDLLQGLALEMLGSLAGAFPQVVPWLMCRMSGRLGRELIGGEQLDVELSHMPFSKVSEPFVQLMTAGKTGALFRFCMECGTALGLNSIDDERIAGMGSFGNKWGVSFQLQDDLLGIFGDAEKLGKPIGSDIREGKRTMLAVRTLAGLSPAKRERFLALYGQQEVSVSDIEEVRELMRESGAVESVRKTAGKILTDALTTLQGLMPPSREYQLLRNLSLEMLDREV